MARKKKGSTKETDTLLVTAADLASGDVSGVLPVANGGSGTGTYTDGQLLIGQTTGNTLAKKSLSGGLTIDKDGVATLAVLRSIGISISRASAQVAGSKGSVVVSFTGTIIHWYLSADQSGSIVFDVKRSGTSIIGTGNKPTLSSVQSANATPSGWTSVTVTAGDVLEFVTSGPATITQVMLNLTIQA